MQDSAKRHAQIKIYHTFYIPLISQVDGLTWLVLDSYVLAVMYYQNILRVGCKLVYSLGPHLSLGDL